VAVYLPGELLQIGDSARSKSNGEIVSRLARRVSTDTPKLPRTWFPV
jgi:hypothetical protein